MFDYTWGGFTNIFEENKLYNFPDLKFLDLFLYMF